MDKKKRNENVGLLVQAVLISAILCVGPTIETWAEIPYYRIENPQSASETESLGYSVCIDGDTMIVGAPALGLSGEDLGQGVARIYQVDASGELSFEAELKAGDGYDSKGFGASVSVSGDTAIIGRPDTNSAFVFTRTDGVWTQQAQLAVDGIEDDVMFGCSVSVSGDLAIVGAYGTQFSALPSGAAYVFRRAGNTWTEEGKLTTEGPRESYGFGASVSVSGDTVIVGYPQDSYAESLGGSAYVFSCTGETWFREARLIADDAGQFDFFGTAVSISGDTVLVGATQKSPQGSAYIFRRADGIWSQETKLLSDQPTEFGDFGCSVSVQDNRAIVGDRTNNSACIFSYSDGAWDLQTRPSILGGPTDRFGASVSISGDVAVIGNPYFLSWNGSTYGSAQVFIRSGGEWSPGDKMFATDETARDDLFGDAVAMSGNTAAVLASNDWDGGLCTGSVSLFEFVNGSWVHQCRLVPDNDYAQPDFAFSLSGDTVALAGNHRHDPHDYGYVKAIHILQRNGSVWSQQTEITLDDLEPSYDFDLSVALNGDTLVAGVPNDTVGVFGVGSIYVYTRSNGIWSQQAKLTAEDVSQKRFGNSVSISGDTILVGAHEDGHAGGNSGSAYVFTRSGETWSQQAKLVADDAAAHDFFGESVSVSGDVAVIGAYKDDDGGQESGAAYIFTRSDGVWTQTAKFSGANEGDWFGNSVSVTGDTVVVGACLEDGATNDTGAVYVYTRIGDTWVRKARLDSPAGRFNDKFGYSVAVNAGRIICGYPGDDVMDTNAGSAYIFDLDDLSTGAGYLLFR